jgi:hypothetical protein
VGLDSRGYVGLLYLRSQNEFSGSLFDTAYPKVSGRKAVVSVYKEFAGDMTSAIQNYITSNGYSYDVGTNYFIKQDENFVYGVWYSVGGDAVEFTIFRKDLYQNNKEWIRDFVN